MQILYQYKKQHLTSLYDKSYGKVQELTCLNADVARLESEMQVIQDQTAFLISTAREMKEDRFKIIEPLLKVEQSRVAKLEALCRTQIQALAQMESRRQHQQDQLYQIQQVYLKNHENQKQQCEYEKHAIMTLSYHSLSNAEQELESLQGYLAFLKEPHSDYQLVLQQAKEWKSKRMYWSNQLSLLHTFITHLIHRLGQYHRNLLRKQHKIVQQQEWIYFINQMYQARAHIELDKEIPHWHDHDYPWDMKLVDVQAIHYTLDSHGFDSFCLEQDLARMKQVQTLMTLNIKTTPFATGTFRHCFYAQDPKTGISYVVKKFHLSRGLEKDVKDCQKTAKLYAYCRCLIHEFDDSLLQAQRHEFKKQKAVQDVFQDHRFDVHTFSIVDCYYAYMPSWSSESYENQVVLIEPLLPIPFSKWMNNNFIMRHPDIRKYPHLDALAALVHWSFHVSQGQLILSDLQGSKRLGVYANRNLPLQQSLLQSTSCPDSTLTRGTKTIHWVLSDPVLHYVASSCPTLRFDYDGDLGIKAKEMFQTTHMCGDRCRLLGLPRV